MEFDLDKCPECGYVNNNRPNICPSCGYNLQKYREEVIEVLRIKTNDERIENDYKEALKLFALGDFFEARILFLSLKDYKDSASYLEQCIEGQYKGMIEEFKSITALYEFFFLKEHEYNNFKEIIQNHNAKNIENKIGVIAKRFKDIEKYKDTEQYVEAYKLFKTFLRAYNKEVQLLKKYDEAYKLFEAEKYQDATKILNEIIEEKFFSSITHESKKLLTQIETIEKQKLEARKAKEEYEKAQREAKRIAREKKKKKMKTVWIAIILAILVAIIIGISIYKSKEEAKYGASNITISVVSKTNGSQTFDIYTTNLKINVTNGCTEKITYITGDMLISTSGGIELWSGAVNLTGDIYGNRTGSWNLELRSDNLDLWNYNLTEIKIEFKINSAHFDGFTIKRYSENYKIIYPKS